MSEDAATTAKQSLEAAQQELQRLERTKQALLRRFQTARAKLQALVDHADVELKRLANEPSNEANQRLVAMNLVRRQAATANLETVILLQTQNMAAPFNPALMAQLELLHHRSQFCTMEFQMLNYQPILNQLTAALAAKDEAGAEAATAVPAGPPKAPGAPPRPGTAPLKPAAPPQLGAPRSAPLARPNSALRPPGGLPKVQAPLPKAPAGTGALSRPGTAPLAGGTGGLSRPGTGALGRPAAANFLEELRKCVQDPERKAKLQDLVVKLQDVEFSLMPLRGLEPGEMAVSPQESAVALRQIAGKMYYINRALAALGPLGAMIPFEGVKPDPALNELWKAVGTEAPEGPEEEAKAGNAPSLAGRLRSLFG